MIKNITCPNCNFTKKVPEEKIPRGMKLAKCPQCKQTFEIDPKDDSDNASHQDMIDNVSGTEEAHNTGTGMAEDPGYFKALWQTLKGAMFSPTEFFSGKRQEQGIGESLAFGVLMGALGSMFGIFWTSLLGSPVLTFILKILPESANLNSLSVNHFAVKDLIISPLLVLISMFITTAIYHCCLFILGGATRGFAGTFKACAYSNATSIFNLVPFIGQFIGFIWGMVIMAIGVREIHETSTLRAVLAMLLPLFLLIILGIILGFVVAFYFSSQL